MYTKLISKRTLVVKRKDINTINLDMIDKNGIINHVGREERVCSQ